MPDRASFRLCGVASNIVKRLTRRDNKPWAQFVLSTRKTAYALMMFNDAYEQYGQALQSEALVVVHGSTSVRDGEVSLRVSQLLPLERHLSSLVEKITWVLDPAEPTTPEFLRNFRRELDDFRGETAVEFGFRLQSGETAVSAVAGSLLWGLSAERFKEFRGHPAIRDIRVEPAKIPELDLRPPWARKNGA